MRRRDSVAQELLARHTERVKAGDDRLTIESVCLLNGGVVPEAHSPTFTQRLLASPLGFLVSKRMTKRRFCAAISGVFGEHKALCGRAGRALEPGCLQ